MHAGSPGSRIGWFALFAVVRIALFAGAIAGVVALWHSIDPTWPAWQRWGLLAAAVLGAMTVLRAVRGLAWRRHGYAWAGGCGGGWHSHRTIAI